MKPDGVATTPAEPATNEELVRPDNESTPQLENPENEGKQEGATSTLPPYGKEENGKILKPKNKTKAAIKTKPGTESIKATTLTGVSYRIASAESRMAANGVKKAGSVGACKKPASLTSEMKKSASIGACAQVKKVPTATTGASRTQLKAAEQKAVASARPVPLASSGARKTATATSQALTNKPVAGGNNAATKPKTTAPRTTTAPVAKTNVPLRSRAASIPKSTRPTVATASRPATSSKPVRLTTTASKSTALKTTISAPSGAKSSSSSQPFKFSTTVAAKKDISTTTSAAARKQLASTATRATVPKASKPEPHKPAAAAKRVPTDTKTLQQKMTKAQVSLRRGPQSPQNISSRTASGRTAAELGNHKQGDGSNLFSAKVQTAKPMQFVLPLVIKGKPSVEPPSDYMEPSAIIETTAAPAPVESVLEIQVLVAEVQIPFSEPTNVDPTNVDPIIVSETTETEPLAIQSVPTVSGTSNSADEPKSDMAHDNVLAIAPTAQEIKRQGHVTASPCEVSVTAQMAPKDFEAVEKQEQIINNFEEDEEDEREGSQQVSVSDMSGTQPTEESRPGSAGVAGSLWRAGGLPSEFDSEDVSCSQHGASELSAPGVLEGTESMDDLGEASLKGADEGASAGSPDFEKFPDIPGNEDDDDEDHVDDMDVGSEMTEDPHGQCNDNDNEDEDEDVEMASEGVTESGLESYGNADEDDFAEDYRLDNLNRMQPLSIVPAFSSADAWVQSLQADSALVSSPSSNPWQTYSELPNQPAAEACFNIGSAKTAQSPPTPAVMDPFPSLTLLSLEPAAEIGMDCKQELTSHSQCISHSSTLLGPEIANSTLSSASTHNELKGNSISPVPENQKQLISISPFPVAVPDVMQDLETCGSDHAGFKHEQPETPLPADDPSTVITYAPPPHSTSTVDEASDPERNVQPINSIKLASTQNERLDDTQVAQSMSSVLEECEEVCVELDGAGGSGTPQSATSAASYGFEGTTSNSNAQSTTESCIKSPGIFSLENEEQLSDEPKDSLSKDLSLAPAAVPVDADQQVECLLKLESQYMHCGKVSEELPDTVPSEPGLDSTSCSEHQQHSDADALHPYYSTICEKTNSFLTGSDLCVPQQENVPTFTTRPSKHHPGVRVDHVTWLPTDLLPRMPNVGCNAQLRRLEQHQQQLAEIEQWREQRNLIGVRQMEESEVKKSNVENRRREDEEERECEQKRNEEEEEEEEELGVQRRHLLQLKIQQQEQELKQKQQIMQWQQELEEQTQQGKQQNSHHKNSTTVLLSPSGLCTIYEALEPSDAEENKMEERQMVLELKLEHKCFSKDKSSVSEADTGLDNPDSLKSPGTAALPNFLNDHEPFTRSALTGPSSAQPLSPLELDWNEKTDIVQQLINQTLLLNGDKCSPLLPCPGGAAGTLSPLETNLWPNLAQMTPLSATVTSVSSYSAELSGSSPQGEWTVVELETHH